MAVYPGGEIVDIFEQTGQHVQPSAINKSGAIAGTADWSTTAVWIPQTSELLNLNSVFGWTAGTATWVNDNNAVAGYGTGGSSLIDRVPNEAITRVEAVLDDGIVLAYGNSGPFVYAPGLGVTHFPGGSDLLSRGNFNSAGQVLLSQPVLGQIFAPGAGVITQPGVAGFSVVSFNSLGQFVGYNSDSPSIYTASGGAIQLNTLLPANNGWTLTAVFAINNAGQILVHGNQPRGNNTSLLLTPVVAGQETDQSAPEGTTRNKFPTSRFSRQVAQPLSGCQSFSINLRDVCPRR